MYSLRECRDCGLLQHLPVVPDGGHAHCIRCNSSLHRHQGVGLHMSLICTAATLALFGFSLQLPMMSLYALGRTCTASVMTGPEELMTRNMTALAVVVVTTMVVMPLVKFGIMFVTLVCVHLDSPPRWLPWVFGFLELVAPWAMIEVFLLGLFVAYTRLGDLATVEVGPAVLALIGTMLTGVTAEAFLDREQVWMKIAYVRAEEEGEDTTLFEPELEGRISVATADRLNALPAEEPDELRTGPDEGFWIGCKICEWVSQEPEGEKCPRCRHTLRFRKKRSVARTWAFVATALIVYIPANVFPVMTVLRMGKGGPHTIMSGVIELVEARLWPLAAIVFLASIIVPSLKLIGLVGMLIMIHMRSGLWLKQRTVAFRFIHAIGRWSMIDVFMLTALVGTVRLGFISSVLPGVGAVAFCGVVILTMLATDYFDPRLMWDAAEALPESQAVAVSDGGEGTRT